MVNKYFYYFSSINIVLKIFFYIKIFHLDIIWSPEFNRLTTDWFQSSTFTGILPVILRYSLLRCKPLAVTFRLNGRSHSGSSGYLNNVCNVIFDVLSFYRLEYLWDQSNITGSSGPTVFLPHHSLFLTKPTLRQRLHQHHRSSIRGR